MEHVGVSISMVWSGVENITMVEFLRTSNGGSRLQCDEDFAWCFRSVFWTFGSVMLGVSSCKEVINVTVIFFLMCIRNVFWTFGFA
jgi:hypothetical protein